MRMNRMAALTMGAGMITMAACSDAPTAAPSAAALPKTTSFAVGDVVGSAVQLGKVIICKTGNAAGTFNLSNQLIVNSAPSGAPGATQVSVTNGTCEIAFEDGNTTVTNGTEVTITEVPAANTVQSLTTCKFKGAGDPGETDCSLSVAASRFVNAYHGYTITYNNAFTPPPDICTYTKGWYQNKNGEPTIINGIDGRSTGDQIKIFNASPGQPGDVQWGILGGSLNNKPNNLLNLYQQLLAALNNLDGNATAGPPAVDAAISAALAATSGAGTIIRVVDGTDISGLISVLSAFNEGQYAGYPHCSDEVLPQ
jgi:hypothetical protein